MLALGAEVETPALILDRTALAANVAAFAAIATSTGVALRPHVKAHKSVRIARAQLDAGAIGLA
ncbi:MAG: DSD1 family PLP-dependent enzyme, partial [Gemmobacter sp.]